MTFVDKTVVVFGEAVSLQIIALYVGDTMRVLTVLVSPMVTL